MLSIEYKDVLKGNEIKVQCRDGKPEELCINNIPDSVTVREGIFTAFANGEKISYRVQQKNNCIIIQPEFNADSLLQCMLLKDSLLLLPLDDKDLLLRLRITCAHKDEGFNRLMLVLDLGNTRTCALTCSTLWDPTDQHQWSIHPMAFEPLKMRLNYKDSSVENCDAVFSSKCVLGLNVHDDWTRSFMQLANNADMFLRNIPSLNNRSGHVSAWRWILSGPKRYFWQQDILRYRDGTKSLDGATSQLHYIVPGKNDENYELRILDQGLAQAMGYSHLLKDPAIRERAKRAGFYPYSIFLKGMLWELMEQAELQANKNKDTQYPFRLTDLVITFPAVWTEEERKEYEKQIRETADLYVQQRCGNCADRIVLDVRCDEGMAVLVTYLYSEIRRKQKLADKIAVIDVGGGTSDLVVGQIEQRVNELYGSKYLISPVYSNGTNEAGDAFIHTLIVNFVVPTVLNWMFNDLTKDDYRRILGKFEEIIESNDGAQFINRESLEKMVFEFWYPAALKLLNKAKSDVRSSGEENFEVALDSYMSKSLTELWRILRERCGELRTLLEMKHNPERLRSSDEGGELRMTLYNSNLELINSGDFLKYMKDAVRKTFAETLTTFSKTITSYGCKKVLLSGKISEIKLVQEVFREYFKVNGNEQVELISMNGYDYKNLPIKEAISQDSKYATVTGAALYHMIKTGRLIDCDIEILPQKKEDFFIWGILREGEYKPITKFLNAAIDRFKRPVYVARKCSDDAPWLPSYELRVNPMRLVVIDEDSPVKFRFSAKDPYPVLVGEGRFALDGKWYDTKDKDDPELTEAYHQAFQFRIFKLHNNNTVISGNLSWLDNGMVFENI